MNARQVAKRLARKAGYDVRRVSDPGNDASFAIQMLLSGVSHPVILDVGANTGQSVSLFRRVLPSAHIHCFEPGPTAFRDLQQNTSKMENVRLNNVGVGARAGVQVLRENDHTDMSSFLPLAEEGWGTVTGTPRVQVITLDDYCRDAGIDRVDVLKSDTQGYDLEVLKGAEQLLRGHAIRLVYAEVTFAPLYRGLPGFDELYRFLFEHDMRLVGLYNHVMRDGVIAWCDVLFAADPRSTNATGP